jgi:hypothetical protein
LEIKPKKFAPGTIDYKRAALEDLFRKLHGRDPEDGCKDDDLIGKVVVELEVLRDSEKAAAICFDVQGWVSEQERDAFLKSFAVLINHLVVGMIPNDSDFLSDRYDDRKTTSALAALGARLEYSFQSILAAGPRS